MRKKKYRSLSEQFRVDQQNTYDETNTEQIKLKLNKKTDCDILDWLRKQKYCSSTSMQGEIKRLIREEIVRNSCRYTPTEK